MYKKCKVVMLPSNEKASFKIGDIGLHPEHGLVINKNPNLDRIIKAVPKIANYTKQHLYILSDEKIEEGDWCLHNEKFMINDKDDFHIGKCKSIENGWIFINDGQAGNPDYTKKIIASTNSSLTIKEYIGVIDESNGIKEYCEYLLPQPSTAFVEKYIAEYNKGNIITDVMVKYEEYDFDEEWSDISGAYETYKERLKISDNNTITISTLTIRKVKDSWSREEVIEKLNFAYQFGLIENKAGLRDLINCL